MLVVVASLSPAAGSPPQPDILSDYDPLGALWGSGRPLPALDEPSLPFTRGLLTFGSGMSVKMTVTRLQQVGRGRVGVARSCPIGRLLHGWVLPTTLPSCLL